MARVQLHLTDAPAAYQEVNVDIQGAEVHANDGNQGSGWQSLNINAGVYNLLDLTNGLDVLLGETVLPAGKISQLRLVLGENNTLKVDGQVSPLSTPSGMQSGLKVQIHQDLEAGITYKILLDFEAALSVVPAGSGKYNLKPVIRATTEAQDGAIKGSVNPAASSPVVYAYLGADTEATTSTQADESGNFLIKGLAAGTYRLVLVPVEGFQQTEVSDVNVTIGNVTDVGVVQIP
jgi:hypothetical protein